MIIESEDLDFEHPDYTKNRDTFEFLRISFEGEAEVKKNAEQFLTIPTAMRPNASDRGSVFKYQAAAQEAQEYVMRASYPEAPSFAIDMATGKSWSQKPVIIGESVKPILGEVFADGSDFRSGVTKILASYLKFGGGGIFVNLNKKRDAVITHYPINTVVNWYREYADTRMVTLEQFVGGGSKFDHATTTKRMVLGLDDDTGEYFAEPWRLEEKRNAKGAVTGHDWVRDKERVSPTMGGRPMDRVPFIAIGGWDHKRPVFQPLVRLARSYFQASAELEHSAYIAAIPQAYLNFKETNNQPAGFWGVDDFEADGMGGEDADGGGSDIEILWGSSRPILLTNGELKFVTPPTGQLQFLENRCINIAENMAGLGLRAFRNSTNAAQTAETERLQQSSEGAIVRSAAH